MKITYSSPSTIDARDLFLWLYGSKCEDRL